MQGVVPQGITPFTFRGVRRAVEAGIGGEMVFSRTRQAAGVRLRGTGTQVKAVNPGKAKLIAELDKQIGEQCSEMVKKLIDDFIAGKATSMRMLCALADELIDCENPEVMSQLCSVAEKLRLEPQVTEDVKEETGESEAANKQVSEEASQQVSEEAELVTATQS